MAYLNIGEFMKDQPDDPELDGILSELELTRAKIYELERRMEKSKAQQAELEKDINRAQKLIQLLDHVEGFTNDKTRSAKHRGRRTGLDSISGREI